MAKKKVEVAARLAPKGVKCFEFEVGYKVCRDGAVWSQRVRDQAEYSSDMEWRRIATGKHQIVRTVGGKVTTVPALVLEVFVGGRPPGMSPRHRDGDETNNSAQNLFWGPPVRAQSLTKKLAKQIWTLHQKKNLGPEEIAQALDIKGTGPIRMILEGRTWNDVTGLPRTVKRSKSAVLNEDLVREIMRLHTEEGKTAPQIAVALGLGQRRAGTVDRVLKGQGWNDVTGLPRGGS